MVRQQDPAPSPTRHKRKPILILLAVILEHAFDQSGLSAAAFTWNMDANANWNASANWNPNTGFPDAVDDMATFGAIITAPRTITLGEDITVGRIDFNNANAYAISGANTLAFGVSSGNATVNVASGAHTINSSIVLNNSLAVSTAGSTTANFAGTVSESGGAATLIKTGAGTVTLSGNNTFTGGVDLAAGVVSLGSTAALGSGSLDVTANSRLRTTGAAIQVNNSDSAHEN